MARNNHEEVKYVYDLPYFERRELCRILDLHDKWEELAGIHMKFDVMKIHALRREVMRGNSPSEELLTMWGQQNHTVVELFALLSKMQHYQAMMAIKKFVDVEYHRLIYEGEENLSRLITKHSRTNHSTSNGNPGDFAGIAGPSGIRNRVNHQATSFKTLDIDQCNMNESRLANKVPEKEFFNTRTDNSEEKIINVDYNSPVLRRCDNNINSNGQTIVMNVTNGNRINSPESPSIEPQREVKNTNGSEISSLAETVGTLPQISFKELEIATNGWDPHTILGKGGFGTVYKGTWKNTNVAIKRTRNTDTDENQTVQIQQILGELKMLNSYRHDNILPLYGFSLGGEDPCLIYQFMPNGSLEDRLQCRQGTRPLSWFQKHNIATGTARGLQFLHTIGNKPLIHGDIKSANILLDSNFDPRIGDFGLAREGPYNHYTHMKVSRVHGTRPYLPDEFLRAKKFSTKVDTYSFGIVLFELATGLRAYDEQRSNKFLKDHVENETSVDVLMDKKSGVEEQETFFSLITLGKCCISKRPKDRPEMVSVLEKLNLVTVTRDMTARVMSMVRQNSLTPSNPYERQLLHDHLSQQRKLSQSQSTNPGYIRVISPQPPTLPIGETNMYQVPVPGYRTPSPNNPFLLTPMDKVLPEVIHEQSNATVVERTQIDKVTPADVIKSPEIAVSPPTEHISSSSSSSSVESEENPLVPVAVHESAVETPADVNQSEIDYSYVDNVLPLISELGVKQRVEEMTEPEQEVADGNSSGPSRSTAEGKIPWIIED